MRDDLDRSTLWLMLKSASTILTGLPLIVLPTLTAGAGEQTGITSVGPAVFIFMIAGSLLLTLLFRSSVGHMMRFITTRTGRWRIKRSLEKLSRNVLHDVIFPGAYGGLVKIDHAVLTAGGILCIQTKHYSGIVFGAEDEPQWTNVDGVRRRRFLNPIIQNEGRRRALGKVVPDVPVANLVVFTGSVEFTSPPPRNVIHLRNLDSFVAKFVFGPSRVKDWDTVWLTVKAAALKDADTRKDLQAQISFS